MSAVADIPGAVTALESMIEWGPEKNVTTKFGPRILRTAVVPEGHAFWSAWARGKDKLKSLGVSIFRRRDGIWEAQWWRHPEGKSTEQIKAERDAAVEASRAVELKTDIDIPCNEGLSYMPYQRAAIAFASSRPGVLIADEMGLGKSIEAIGVINLDPKIQRVLIICPASLKINWSRELFKWLTRKMTVGIADGSCFPSSDIVIVNYDLLHKFETSLAYFWDLLIVDEAHYLKNPKARRSKCVLGYKSSKKEREGGEAESKSGINARRRVFMTGTPIVNRPVELWPLISSLDAQRWPNFFKYAIRYCGARKIAVGRDKMAWDFSGASHLDELQEILRSSVMVRRLKKDVLTDMPPKMRQVIELPTDGCEHVIKAENDAWDEQEDGIARLEAAVELAKASDDPSVYSTAVSALKEGVQAAFNGISILRHQTALAKIPMAVEHLKECLDDGRKIIVFAWHTDVIAALMDQLKEFNPVKVTGEMSNMQDRQRSVDRFQNDPTVKVFIGNIRAAGVGLTLTAAAHVVFVELDWTPGNVTQAEDRSHRYGQKNSVLIQHLVLAGSLDANIAKTLVRKQGVIDQALDKAKTKIEEAAPVTRQRRGTGGVSPDELDKLAAAMTDDRILLIHEGIKLLAARCNGAQSWDAAGFSKVDVHIGHSFANSPFMTPKMAVIGARLCVKYQRQLPEHIVGAARGTDHATQDSQ